MYKGNGGRPRLPPRRPPRRGGLLQTVQPSVPNYAIGCHGNNDRVFMSTKLNQLRNRPEPNPYAATHLFTGCGFGRGAVGVAYIRGLCAGSLNKGVNQIKDPEAWLTFAHELGHTFGGGHTFEEGAGKTG